MEINDFDKFVILIDKLKEVNGLGWKIDNISLQYAPNQINIRLIKINNKRDMINLSEVENSKVSGGKDE